MSNAASPGGARAPWWREVATLLGVVGLLVTLVFNTFGVWQGTTQARESSETEQINLLTELHAKATESEEAINATLAARYPCFPNRRSLVSKDTDRALRAGLDYYEYLAWLFNHDRLTVADSRSFFSERMTHGWVLAARYIPSQQLSELYPELATFVRETPARDRAQPLCRR